MFVIFCLVVSFVCHFVNFSSPLFAILYLILPLRLSFGICFFYFVCRLVSFFLLCLSFDIFYFSSLCHLSTVTSPLFDIWYLLLLLCLSFCIFYFSSVFHLVSVISPLFVIWYLLLSYVCHLVLISAFHHILGFDIFRFTPPTEYFRHLSYFKIFTTSTYTIDVYISYFPPHFSPLYQIFYQIFFIPICIKTKDSMKIQKPTYCFRVVNLIIEWVFWPAIKKLQYWTLISQSSIIHAFSPENIYTITEGNAFYCRCTIKKNLAELVQSPSAPAPYLPSFHSKICFNVFFNE